MKILDIKSWLKRKKEAQFEFIGEHKIRRLKDGREFKLRFMYQSSSQLAKLCIVYAYTDLIHVDLMSDFANSATIKININTLNIIRDPDKEFLVWG